MPPFFIILLYIFITLIIIIPLLLTSFSNKLNPPTYTEKSDRENSNWRPKYNNT
ncbi:hypothetical protein EFE32_11020 [Lactococcus lactis subsp. lactis]|nr:hypothetical protein [Lactococcus lactis subsp. lactis]